jgi:hypothetical protein
MLSQHMVTPGTFVGSNAKKLLPQEFAQPPTRSSEKPSRVAQLRSIAARIAASSQGYLDSLDPADGALAPRSTR